MAVRQQQRNRTRQAILDAATSLIDAGDELTIETVVEASGVSRATVYRYFDSAADIRWNVMSDTSIPPVEEVMAATGDDLEARVLAAERLVNDYLFADPDGARTFEMSAIRRHLDGTAQPTDRPARRLHFIDGALEGHADDLDDEIRRRLRDGLALAMGVESLIALLDTCRLSQEEARDVTQWVCRALVHQAFRDAGVDES